MIRYTKIVVRSLTSYDGVLPDGHVVGVTVELCEPPRPVPIDVDLHRYRTAGIPIEDPAGILAP